MVPEQRYPEGSVRTGGSWCGRPSLQSSGSGDWAALVMVRDEQRDVGKHETGCGQRCYLRCGEIRCAVSLSCPPHSGDIAQLGDSPGHHDL